MNPFEAELARRRQQGTVQATEQELVQQEPERDEFTMLGAGLRGAADMATFGFADEMLSRVRAIGDSSYEDELARTRDEFRRAQEEHPGSYLTGQIGGGLLTTAIPGGAALRGVTATGRAVRGAVAGGASGGAYGFGSGEDGLDERLGSAQSGAVAGAVAGSVSAPIIGRVADRLALKQAAIPLERIQAQEKAAYQLVDNTDVFVKRGTALQALGDMRQQMVDRYASKNLHPASVTTFRQIADEAEGNVTLPAIHGWRKLINKRLEVAKEAEDRSILRAMRDSLDDTLLKPGYIKQGDVLTPANPEPVVQSLRDALKVSAKRFKVEKIAQMIEDAKANTGMFTIAGYENALRKEFRKLARRLAKNPRNWTKEEVAAIRAVESGKYGKITSARNIARTAGKFQPASPIGILPTAAAAVGGNWPLAMVIAAGGITGKVSARVGTMSAAKRARELASAGGRAPEFGLGSGISTLSGRLGAAGYLGGQE